MWSFFGFSFEQTNRKKYSGDKWKKLNTAWILASNKELLLILLGVIKAVIKALFSKNYASFRNIHVFISKMTE